MRKRKDERQIILVLAIVAIIGTILVSMSEAFGYGLLGAVVAETVSRLLRLTR